VLYEKRMKDPDLPELSSAFVFPVGREGFLIDKVPGAWHILARSLPVFLILPWPCPLRCFFMAVGNFSAMRKVSAHAEKPA
jgi:hypothetical protein